MKSKILLSAKDGVFGRFGDAELHDLLRLDLNRFASRRIAADASFAVDQHELAESGDGERVLGMLVSQGCDLFQHFAGLLLGDAVFVCDGRNDLGFGQSFSHDFVV